MQTPNLDRATPTQQPDEGMRAPSATAEHPRRTIDCSAAPDEQTLRVRRPVRGDARHAWITQRGVYADQVQSI